MLIACKTYTSGLLVQHLLSRSILYFYGGTPPTVGDEPVVEPELQTRILSIADQIETGLRTQWNDLLIPLTNFLIPSANYNGTPTPSIT
jgi:hypothetical protein